MTAKSITHSTSRKSGVAHSRGASVWRAALLVIAMQSIPRSILANPATGVVVHGSASFTQQGPQMIIHTGANTLINWASFNIGAGETTTFIQPSANSVVWNHINDPNPTQILGHLDANGYVILQNQSGFYVGGNAVINAQGLVMTTTPTVPLNVFGSGSWDFNAPPPTAKIINYGELNAGPNGSMFLISQNIENYGTITAPEGKIGLYAGEKVLLSDRADGKGLAAKVTLPEGSVDNSGKLIADAGTIAINAQVVNQGGLVEANSVKEENGVIDIVASDNITLGSSSTVSAKGESTGISSGGQVTIKSGGTYNDTTTSTVDVSGGAEGGNGGKAEISATELNSIQSQVNGHANEGWVGGKMTIDPANITLIPGGPKATTGTINAGDPPAGTLLLDPNSLNTFSQIDLQATGNITLAGAWVGPSVTTSVNPPATSTLTLQAGNNILLGAPLSVGPGWNVNLIAGANFKSLTSVTAGTGSILMSGTGTVQAANGDISLIAGGIVTTAATPVTTGTPGSPSSAAGSILMQAYGGNILLGSSSWTLPDSSTPTALTLEAANNILFGSQPLTLGKNWNVNMIAGADFSKTPVGVLGNLATGSGALLIGTGAIQSTDGGIDLTAANTITVGGTINSTEGGSILLKSVSPAGSILLGSTAWTLSDSAAPASVTMESGGGITIGAGIYAGQNWNINLVAGATFDTPTSVNNQNTGTVTVGGGILRTQNGNVNVTAGGSVSTTSGSIVTFDGGNISVDAVGGNVNTGLNPNGYSFQTESISTDLGGFSTAAGGNVTIKAGGDVISYLPTIVTQFESDAGTGAFGPEPGVVTITAGGNVYGHYIAVNSVANGVVTPSTITAENGNAGSSAGATENLALSEAIGSWVVNAPHGSINLQEVRNPDGTLNGVNSGSFAYLNNVFDYAPNASVTLNAGNAVNLLGDNLPRESGYLVPILYPPILTINAGAGGVSLENDVTLFPSSDGQLTVNTTVPAGTPANPAGTPPPGSFEGGGFTLAVSDSSATQWIGSGPGSTDFANDHGATPIQLNSTQPIVFNIAGNLDNVTIISPKAASFTVGGDMDNVNFTGQNLHSSDVTSFNVAGKIFDQSAYSVVTLTPALTLPPALFPGAQQNFLQLLQNAVYPGASPSSPNPLFPSLSLFYISSTHQLGYYGVMTPAVEAQLLGPLQEISYAANGQPIVNLQGQYVTTTTTFASDSGTTKPLYQAIQSLFAASQNAITPSQAPQGIQIGGPGQLDITAQSMDLGVASLGIASVGPKNNSALAKISGGGAAIKINLTGDLDMFASEISSRFGGAIDINAGGSIDAGLAGLPFLIPNTPLGIWSSAKSDINVIANGNISVDGSRIAAFDGGNVFVESLEGNVDAGDGGLNEILVNEVVVNPKTGVVSTPQQPITGSGILATTLPDASHNLAVGNITIKTPNGDIDAGLGGITQEPENGNPSQAATVTLNAGGNINAKDTGVIAINVNATAGGQINGLFIATKNSSLEATTISATDIAGGTVNLNATGAITGIAIGGSGINISGGGKFEGVAFSESVSGGGAVSALAAVGSAAAGTQNSAAGEANSQKNETTEQATSAATEDELNRKRLHKLLAKYTGRVTVLLPAKH